MTRITAGVRREESTMGIGDKAKDLSGKVKESVGDATNNPDLQREGAKDRTEAAVNDAADKARKGVDDLKENSSGLGEKMGGAKDALKDRFGKDNDAGR
ncbi:CsbD family protein [Brevibacterium yomogidense]|nr:CsbD family protein [Brevibacterium yomogidense]